MKGKSDIKLLAAAALMLLPFFVLFGVFRGKKEPRDLDI